MSAGIVLGSWVEHPEHGFAQVWGTWIEGGTDESFIPGPPVDDGIVRIVTEHSVCHDVLRSQLTLAEPPVVEVSP